MKSYTVHECEGCGKKSENFDEIRECEAKHLGLTVGEYREYQDLIFGVEAFTHMMNKDNSESTKNGFKIFTEDLEKFKVKHNII